jgi:hypothetical protein
LDDRFGGLLPFDIARIIDIHLFITMLRQTERLAGWSA